MLSEKEIIRKFYEEINAPGDIRFSTDISKQRCTLMIKRARGSNIIDMRMFIAMAVDYDGTWYTVAKNGIRDTFRHDEIELGLK